MVRAKSFSASALLLFVAFVLLLLTVISAPITRFSSNTKFGVFGYCYTNGSCSGIHIGYDTDSIISRSTSVLTRRTTSIDHAQQASTSLGRRQNGGGAGGGGGGNGGNGQSMFNLPSNTRSNLSNVLVVHVVAAGLTLILSLMTIFGHLKSASESSAYMLAVIILSIPTLALTLLAFLIDILIFVPNLDWGTWITLAATVLNAIAAVLICTTRRKMKARVVMRKRIAENDELSNEHYYNSQHLHDPVVAPDPQMEQLDKATLPRFNAHDYDHPEPIDNETVPLNRREPDSRSMRSETASLTSPPKYPAPGYAYGNAHELQELQPPPEMPDDYSRARIPYGNPPRHEAQDHQRPRAITRDDSYGSNRSVQPPLVHAQEPLRQEYGANANIDNENSAAEPWRSRSRNPDNVEVDDHEQGQDWDASTRRGTPRDRRQRVVSGPRPMPTSQSEPRMPVRSASGNYYEDVPPQFEQGSRQRLYQDDTYLEPRQQRGPRRHTPQGSGSFERPAYPQQPRSPDTLSNSSHFTSVSQRGINPAWRGDNQPSNMRSYNSNGGPPRQERRGPPKPNILADNPDFVLPGAGAGRSRLPNSRRPGAIAGLSASNLSAGPSPYAITKAV